MMNMFTKETRLTTNQYLFLHMWRLHALAIIYAYNLLVFTVYTLCSFVYAVMKVEIYTWFASQNLSKNTTPYYTVFSSHHYVRQFFGEI